MESTCKQTVIDDLFGLLSTLDADLVAAGYERKVKRSWKDERRLSASRDDLPNEEPLRGRSGGDRWMWQHAEYTCLDIVVTAKSHRYADNVVYCTYEIYLRYEQETLMFVAEKASEHQPRSAHEMLVRKLLMEALERSIGFTRVWQIFGLPSTHFPVRQLDLVRIGADYLLRSSDYIEKGYFTHLLYAYNPVVLASTLTDLAKQLEDMLEGRDTAVCVSRGWVIGTMLESDCEKTYRIYSCGSSEDTRGRSRVLTRVALQGLLWTVRETLKENT